MALRSRNRKLSFDILSATTDDGVEFVLHRSITDPLTRQNGDAFAASGPKPSRKKRKNRGSKKKATIECSIAEGSVLDVIENGDCRSDLEVNCSVVESVVCEVVTVSEDSACTVRPVREVGFQNVENFEGCLVRELR